jgi:hypothetical protein
MTTVPDVYDSDVDEMTAGQLVVLLEIRLRLASFAGTAEIVDAFAAELVANLDEADDGDQS